MRQLEGMIVRMGVLGWLGYALAMGAVLLFVRLWYASRPTELRRMQQSLLEADKRIKGLNDLLRATAKERDELRQQHQRLHNEYLELRGQFSELNKAFGKQAELVGQLRNDLKAEQEKRDAQYLELMRMKAKLGDL